MSIADIIFNIKKTGVLIFFCVTLCSFAQKGTTKKNYIEGKLKNKIQFFIQKNNSQSIETLFYFAIKIGSAQETDSELGYAHFLEHMAFKGGKRFYKKKITQFLKEQGLQAGIHYNAVTNYDYTLYKIKLPKKADLYLQKQIFNFFADILNGLTLFQKDIENEKNIIRAEKEASRPPKKRFLFRLGKSLYKKRCPIGTSESIKNINSKKLKKFYNKWYQPKNAGIFVVGNINPEKTKQLIEKTFGKIKNKTKQSADKIKIHKQLTNDVFVKIDTTKPKNKIYLEFALKHKPKNKKGKIAEKIFKKILLNRLYFALKKETQNIDVYSNYFLSDVNYFTISLSIKGKISKAIETILLEIKRISEFGVSKEELLFYTTNQKKEFKNKSKKNNNNYVISNFIDSFLGVIEVENQKTPNKRLYNITIDNIKKNATELCKKSKKRVFIELSKKREKQFLVQQFDKLLQKVEHKKITNKKLKTPHKKNKNKNKNKKYLKTERLLETLPIKKEYFSRLNITKITYKNGLQILLKPLKSKENEIQISGFAKGGTSFISDSLYPQYESTVSYMDLGGVGNLNNTELNNYMSDKNMGLSLNITEYQRSFFGFFEKKHKKEFIKYLYLKLTKARKNKKEFDKIISEKITEIKKQSSEKKTKIATKKDFKVAELKGTYFPNRNTPETIEDYKKLSLKKINKLYKKAFSYSNDWKMIIVGNFSTKKTIPILNQYFGNLKKTDKPIENRVLFNKNKFKNYFKFESSKPEKTIKSILLFYNRYENGLKNNLLQLLFKKMLQDKVTNLLREKHGYVYTPTVELEKQESNFGFNIIEIAYRCKPEDNRKVKQILLNWLSGIKKIKISQIDFQIYKNQIFTKYNSTLKGKNTHKWIDVLKKSVLNKESIKEIENFEQILNKITAEDFYKNIAKNFDINSLKTVEVTP